MLYFEKLCNLILCMANIVDTDQAAEEQPDLGLQCLLGRASNFFLLISSKYFLPIKNESEKTLHQELLLLVNILGFYVCETI